MIYYKPQTRPAPPAHLLCIFEFVLAPLSEEIPSSLIPWSSLRVHTRQLSLCLQLPLYFFPQLDFEFWSNTTMFYSCLSFCWTQGGFCSPSWGQPRIESKLWLQMNTEVLPRLTAESSSHQLEISLIETEFGFPEHHAGFISSIINAVFLHVLHFISLFHPLSPSYVCPWLLPQQPQEKELN